MSRSFMLKAESQEWQTPADLFDALFEVYGPFDLDPFCRPNHYTAMRVLGAGGSIMVPPDTTKVATNVLIDGFANPWNCEAAYTNPPYTVKELEKATDKAVLEVREGRAKRVVALLPVKSDQDWWQRNCIRSVKAGAPTHMDGEWHTYDPHPQDAALDGCDVLKAVRFWPKRIKFENDQGRQAGSTFASAIVVWEK